MMKETSGESGYIARMVMASVVLQPGKELAVGANEKRKGAE